MMPTSAPDHEYPFVAMPFTALFSGAGTWRARLISRATRDVLDQEACLPSEVSKLMVFSGEELVRGIHHGETVLGLERVVMRPEHREIDLQVAQRPFDTPVLMCHTVAQGIINDQLMSKVSTPATQALALIYLNDHLFRIDPARLIYLVGESQYEEYDYLAALLLYALQKGLHPELAFRKVFDDVGLGGRYSDDAMTQSLQAIEKTLRQAPEPTPLTNTLLKTNPGLFIRCALLQPILAGLNPLEAESDYGYWKEALALSGGPATIECAENTLEHALEATGLISSAMGPEERHHVLGNVNQGLTCADTLCATRTFQAVLKPRHHAESLFDTGLTNIRF